MNRTASSMWLLVAVLLFAAYMGARGLNADGIWFDEWWSLYTAGASDFGPPLAPGDIWTRIATEDPVHPPGYALLLAAWGNVAGWSEASGRALSWLLGLLAIAVTYRLGRAFGGIRVGLGAALTLGASGWLIHNLHEMRMYTLYALAAALFVLIYVETMARSRPSTTRPLLLAATTALLIYTHYFAGLLLVAVVLWHLARLVRGRPDRRWWSVGIAIAVGASALLPWLGNAARASGIIQEARRFTTDDLSQLLSIIGDVGFSFSNGAPTLLALLLLLSLRMQRARHVLLLALAVLALNLIAYRIFFISEVRYAVNLMPLLAVLAGFGMAVLARLRGAAQFVAAVWVGSVLLVDGTFAFTSVIQRTVPQPFREMAALLAPRVREGDVVINHLGNHIASAIQGQPFVHYFGRLPGERAIIEIETLPSVEAYAERVGTVVAGVPRVWITYSPQWPSSEWSLFIYLLDQLGYAQCTTVIDDERLRILGFGRLESDLPEFVFAEHVRSRLLDPPLLRDGLLSLWVGYDIGESVPPDTYSIGMYLLDDTGTLRAQSDIGLPPVGRHCQAFELDTRGLEAGTYEVAMAVYDWRSGERLARAGIGGEAATTARLATIRLEQEK